MAILYKIPLVLQPQREGGYTVTSPSLPELLTEGDTVDEALENVKDALQAVVEIYQDQGRPLPAAIVKDPEKNPIEFDFVVRAA